MTDKEKILKKIHDEMDGLMDAQGNFEYPEHEGAYHALCNLEHFIDSMPEETVSEDLEAAQQYAKYTAAPPSDVAYHFVAGANWQKKQMLKNFIEGIVTLDYWDDKDREVDVILADNVFAEEHGIKDGDKVKLIIVKEE